MSTTLHIPTFTIADRLRKAREDAGLKQHQLADLLEVDANTVSNYENGNTKRHQRITLTRWALVTGVPVEWIKTGEIPGDVQKPPTIWMATTLAAA
jgi:transcriptional regulator with XRE-family HTH domain